MVCFGVLSVAAQTDTLTLKLSDCLSDYPQTETGYWEGTYGNDRVETPYFIFSHQGDGEAAMAYWEGFTVCTSGDTENYGTEGSSDAWITRQWGCMAGGGLNDQLQADAEQPYMVAYWGFHAEQLDPAYHSVQIGFADGRQHKPVGVWICNHPWPYYGNINGDGFASAFSTEGDYFALVAHGLNDKGEPTGGKVRFMLAEYKDGKLNQSRDWQYMDLSPLGTVNGLFFTMETSDTDALYGANTAVYFCLDRLQVLAYEEASSLARPSGLKTTAADETTITLSWNKTDHAQAYNVYLDGDSISQTADTFFVFSGLEPLKEYTLSVVAINGEMVSDTASLTATTLDLTAPAAPTRLTAETTEYSITLRWQAATDNVGVKRYTVYLDGEPIRRIADTTYTVSGLEPATEYRMEVEAEDASGNRSEKVSLTVSTLGITALPQTTNDLHQARYYTIDGRYTGDVLPAEKGVYIMITNNKSTKILIH